MRQGILIAVAAAHFASSTLAQTVNPHISDVLRGATAMTTLNDGTVLVSKQDAAFICFIDIVDLYAQVLAEGRPEIVRQPAAICVSADVFTNLGDR
jgi:hypothetical protein